MSWRSSGQVSCATAAGCGISIQRWVHVSVLQGKHFGLLCGVLVLFDWTRRRTGAREHKGGRVGVPLARHRRLRRLGLADVDLDSGDGVSRL